MTSYDPKKLHEIHQHLKSHLPSDSALRVKALESLLVEKGLLDLAAVDAFVEAYSEEIGPKRGAAVVARAWTDSAFKARLLENATAATEEMGFAGQAGAHLIAVANTPTTHNLVVCTLCSCYPLSVLGVPPAWYKSAAYRARAVREPRGVLAEFGLTLPESIAIRIWDSTSEQRYFVVPERPAGTEGWSAERLARLVTRNAMVGTGRALSPAELETA
jgi:nitrile hydratase